jgi:hypothetical protein
MLLLLVWLLLLLLLLRVWLLLCGGQLVRLRLLLVTLEWQAQV